jgi:ammonium transporter Rh
MIIHMFGAFFGLGLSKALTSAGGPKTSSHNASVYHSDVFAMIGTVFLWMYWPSFNSILASGHTEERIVVNTVLSLCASCLTTFCMTTLLNHKKLEMVDIQNATLAGGVAMGTSGALTIGPGAALLIGALAGVVSTLGYKYASPFLEKHGIGDECGVFNLHGMPSILGAVAGIIAVAVQDKYSAEQLAVIYGIDDPDTFNSSDQALMQLLYFGVTMAVSVVTGYLTGLVVVNCKLRVAKDDEQFNDAEYWHVPSEEIPQFFSKDQ